MSADWHGQEGAVHTTAREVGGKCVVCVYVRGVGGGVTWRVLMFSAVKAKRPINKHAQGGKAFA